MAHAVCGMHGIHGAIWHMVHIVHGAYGMHGSTRYTWYCHHLLCQSCASSTCAVEQEHPVVVGFCVEADERQLHAVIFRRTDVVFAVITTAICVGETRRLQGFGHIGSTIHWGWTSGDRGGAGRCHSWHSK